MDANDLTPEDKVILAHALCNPVARPRYSGSSGRPSTTRWTSGTSRWS
jgi:hypothetical protein